MRKLKIIRVTKWVALTIQFLTSFAKIYIEFVEPDPFKVDDVDYNHNGVLQLLLIITMSARILENLFMMFFTFHNIFYFLKMKISNLSIQGKDFTNFNIMITTFMIVTLILRPFAFITIDSIIIARLVSDVSGIYML